MKKIKILIVHTAFIGDIVLATPLIRKIKDVYPQSDIYFLTTPQGATILKNDPDLTKVIAYDKRGIDKGIGGLLKIARSLRKEHFQMVITPHRYLRSSVISYLTGAAIRKCYDNAVGSFLFTDKIPYKGKNHEVERLLSFVGDPLDHNYNISLYPSPKDKQVATELLGDLTDKKLLVIAPGSKWFTKKWPLEYFNKVISAFMQNNNIKIAIIGGKEETLLNVILGPNVIDLRGKTTLMELACVIEKADILLTNDSSPIHIGSAFPKVKILAIFGATITNFGFYPWSKNSKIYQVPGLSCRPCGIHGGNKCPKGHFKCMRDILPETIISDINSALLGKDI